MSASPAAQAILDRLQSVAELGQRRRSGAEGQAQAAAGAAWVMPLKAYQAARFQRTYADLLDGRVAAGRYAAGARFFLDELYGPKDFSARDAQFSRVVPTLVRLFPAALVDTVAELVELHALSEQMDDAMAQQLARQQAEAVAPSEPATPTLNATAYIRAWQAVGQPAARERQITLTMNMMTALEKHTRHRLLRVGLRAMRGAAHAAGLGALQDFLEAGFDTFGAMGDIGPFHTLVAQRERALAAALFKAPVTGDAGQPDTALQWLP
ncbi:hypothetical protein AACH10_13925 [Ideonella sp. DXS22W]|uniref:DUF8198 domain-containing protein n=1 Tax=Pseudaquabacterium inlustre TaxID=2984192 RepID=A0ABU9CLC6_9BURK